VVSVFLSEKFYENCPDSLNLPRRVLTNASHKRDSRLEMATSPGLGMAAGMAAGMMTGIVAGIATSILGGNSGG
jgi:hypothetical protein